MKKLQSTILALSIATAATGTQQRPAHSTTGHVTLTDSESLWRERFADCDLGYEAILPNGFVGHGNRSPSPIHGFLVGLPDTGTTKAVTVDDGRFIWVTAEYNSLEFKSLKESADHAIDLMGREKSDFRLTVRAPAKLAGIAATKVRGEYDSPRGRVVEEELIVLRSGIIYEIGLRTNSVHLRVDEQQFERIVAAFKFWKIHNC